MSYPSLKSLENLLTWMHHLLCFGQENTHFNVKISWSLVCIFLLGVGCNHHISNLLKQYICFSYLFHSMFFAEESRECSEHAEENPASESYWFQRSGPVCVGMHQCAIVWKCECLYCCVCLRVCPSASILHFVQIISEGMGPNTAIHTGIRAAVETTAKNGGFRVKGRRREEKLWHDVINKWIFEVIFECYFWDQRTDPWAALHCAVTVTFTGKDVKLKTKVTEPESKFSLVVCKF